MTAKLLDDCFVLDKDRLPHRDALAILKARVRPVVGVEDVALRAASGRYLAAPIRSPARSRRTTMPPWMAMPSRMGITIRSKARG